jgi:hypothetical protein
LPAPPMTTTVAIRMWDTLHTPIIWSDGKNSRYR